MHHPPYALTAQLPTQCLTVAQLRRAHPLLRFQTIRGNLNTRLAKVDNADDYDALILARAGIDRMGWQDRVDEMLDSDVCLYAVGQVWGCDWTCNSGETCWLEG